MKLDKFLTYFLPLLTLLLCCISCSDESEIELYLQKGELQQIPVNDATISCAVGHPDEILIFGGVGNYDVFSSNEKILYPEVTGNSISMIPKSVGKVSITVMDDAHNAQQVTIFVESSAHKYLIYDISYEIEGGNTEEQEAIKSELAASETLYKATINFEFNESESGYANLLLNTNQSEEILVENIPFVWETITQQINISFPNLELKLNSETEPHSRNGVREGVWEADLTEKFIPLYPEILSVRKYLHYRLLCD